MHEEQMGVMYLRRTHRHLCGIPVREPGTDRSRRKCQTKKK